MNNKKLTIPLLNNYISENLLEIDKSKTPFEFIDAINRFSNSGNCNILFVLFFSEKNKSHYCFVVNNKSMEVIEELPVNEELIIQAYGYEEFF